MSDSLNKKMTLPEPQDPYEREIDELWSAVVQDFDNEEPHEELIDKARKYFLLDRVAKYYHNYLIDYPDDPKAIEYQKKIVTIVSFTYLSRSDDESQNNKKSSRILFPLFFFIILFAVLIAGLHYYRLKNDAVAYFYKEGINALFKNELEKARENLEKVMELQPDYRDVQMRLDHIAEIEEKRSHLRGKTMVPTPTPLAEDSEENTATVQSSPGDTGKNKTLSSEGESDNHADTSDAEEPEKKNTAIPVVSSQTPTIPRDGENQDQ